MSKLLTLLAPSSGGGASGPTDPATLSPYEHYTETNWVSNDWECNITNAEFDTKSVHITATTVNGLTAYQSDGYALSALSSISSSPRSLYYDAGGDMTFYFVFRIYTGVTGKYLYWLPDAVDGNKGLIGYVTGAGKPSFYARDNSSRDLIITSTNAQNDNNPHVYAYRLHNVTNEAYADLWVDNVKETQVTLSPWTQIYNNAQIPKLVGDYTGNNSARMTLCEVAYFKTAHTDDQCSGVSQFLMSKWGVS